MGVLFLAGRSSYLITTGKWTMECVSRGRAEIKKAIGKEWQLFCFGRRGSGDLYAFISEYDIIQKLTSWFVILR